MTFDVLIQGGEVLSGERDSRLQRADVGITRDRIAAVGDLSGASARASIDACGRAIAPGFIDVHTHSEMALLGERHRYAGLKQGVTTQFMAPDGFGWAPLASEELTELWEGIRDDLAR